jgi:DNA-binding transcriptional regulator YiaG
MLTTAAASTMDTVPHQRRNPAMTHEEFRNLLTDAGLTIREAAKKLGVGNATVSRWQTDPDKGGTPISEHSAKLIRILIKPKKR